MKMSDHFNLPITYQGMCFQDGDWDCWGGSDYNKDAAAAHAINCHDDLVEALEAVDKVIDIWLPDADDHEHAGEASTLLKIRGKYLTALAKARGEV